MNSGQTLRLSAQRSANWVNKLLPPQSYRKEIGGWKGVQIGFALLAPMSVSLGQVDFAGADLVSVDEIIV
jgi:hypothetical protein